MPYQLRGIAEVGKLFRGVQEAFRAPGSIGGIDGSIAAPLAAGEYGEFRTETAQRLLGYMPKYGQHSPESVTAMAHDVTIAQKNLALLKEAAKHYAALGQVAAQTYSTQAQMVQQLGRVDVGVQRTNAQLAQSGFQHQLGSAQNQAVQAGWTGAQFNARSALYG